MFCLQCEPLDQLNINKFSPFESYQRLCTYVRGLNGVVHSEVISFRADIVRRTSCEGQLVGGYLTLVLCQFTNG